MTKFNMGSGLNRKAGYVNVDAAPESEPDEVFDLETTPWPWADNCAEEVRFNHSLEHMGGDPKVFLAIMKELYRICAPDAVVVVNVPDPRHDNFITDPTHVRPITPHVLGLFDRQANEAWRASGAANTPLALYTGVDFKVESYAAVLSEPYKSRYTAGQLKDEELNHLVRSANNVIEEWRIKLVARKPRA
ncbi:hypothetical protein [Phenylobacterium sp.]|jgi:hypothetical protein|uniref:class I SAM-dependent methyltransferase n=1 Tax=Phenylobacterium sp. TaxID=1871053 RepID=UPI002F40F6FE